MRVAVLTGSVTRASGGLFNSVRELSRCLYGIPDVAVDVHSYSEPSDPADILAWKPITPICHRVLGPWAFRFAPDIRKAMLDGGYDLLHTHGLWLDSSRVAFDWKRGSGGRYLVSPRGMLDPWALANSRWKKRLAAALFENRHLREAACIHALCESEADSIRAYGLKNPIAIIPNGVELPKVGGRRSEVGSHRRTLLFLGRLHPKKGLVPALRAWAATRHSTLDSRHSTPWQFVIAGWDQGGHEAELKRLATDLGIPWADTRDMEPGTPISAFSLQLSAFSLLFIGPAFGEEKDALLRSADAFILPSLSEGLPMSVLEAWAYGLPVLMTPECNLPEGFAAGAAVRIGAEDAKKAECGKLKAESCGNIEGGLHALFEMSDVDRAAMGERGRRLVEERFTWTKVAAQMKEVYEWVLGAGPRPDCVV